MAWTSRTPSATTTLNINGSDRALTPGADFAETIIAAAREAGLGKFRVFLNDSEIDPEDAPETIEAGMRIKLTPFEVAGRF